MVNNIDTVTALKSLADSTRISIVRQLASEGCEVSSSKIVNDCALSLSLSQPTMSHHFTKLVQAGVLSERKSGTEKLYVLNKDQLLSIGIDVNKL